MARDPAGAGAPVRRECRIGRSQPRPGARLLNDGRSVAAVGAPDQGWGMLEAMSVDRAAIVDAWEVIRDRQSELTVSGVTSLLYPLMLEQHELRNPYLADLGHMIAVSPNGMEVLVDVETGRQITGHGRLGIRFRLRARAACRALDLA